MKFFGILGEGCFGQVDTNYNYVYCLIMVNSMMMLWEECTYDDDFYDFDSDNYEVKMGDDINILITRCGNVRLSILTGSRYSKQDNILYLYHDY